eukprot:603351-Pelagomonas_calceolata.AAC.1
MRQRPHQKQKAQEIVNLMNSRCVDAYKVMRAHKLKHATPIPADIWIEHLQQHFVQTQEDGYQLEGREWPIIPLRDCEKTINFVLRCDCKTRGAC